MQSPVIVLIALRKSVDWRGSDDQRLKRPILLILPINEEVIAPHPRNTWRTASPPESSMASHGKYEQGFRCRGLVQSNSVVKTILAVPGGWFSIGVISGQSPGKNNTIVGAHAPRRSVHTLRYL